jgi:hypothetical protein
VWVLSRGKNERFCRVEILRGWMGLKEKLLKIKYIRAAKMIGSVCSLSSEKKLGEGLAGTHVVTYAEV